MSSDERSRMKRKMTPKQVLFCKEYLIDKNATQSAIRAGYSKRSADVIGIQNLGKLRIKERIDAELEKQGERIEITADNVIKEIGKLAFSNVESLISIHNNQPYIDLTDLNKDQWAAISSVSTDTHTFKTGGTEDNETEVVKTKVTLWDKKGSLELLAKHFKLLTEKHEVTGKDGGPLIIPDYSKMTNEELIEHNIMRDIKSD